MKNKILIIDDEPIIRDSLSQLFSSHGHQVQTAETGAAGLSIISAKKTPRWIPDIILLDVNLPDVSGLELLKKLKEFIPETLVIIITGQGSVAQSVEAMQQGAVDYILKPFNVNEIQLRVQKALDNRSLKEHVDYLAERAFGDWDSKYIQGPNPIMRKIYESLERIAKSSSSTVLIHGETGTGKEVIAQRIHLLSPRHHKPFVEVNATALTAELLESELFGHEAGSFTGATKTKKGLFEVADGGTLFLDEIGDMDLAMQAKILRALQERKIRRVGGTDNIEVDIRLVTATNKNLEQAVKEGRFREDLYYRLNVVPIYLPPLRHRIDDIEAFVRHFLKRFNKELGRSVTDIEPAALEALKNYPWPGNVRELRNFMERTMLLECEGNVLKGEHLRFPRGQETLMQSPTHAPSESILGSYVPLETVERQHIEAVLKATNGNKNQAAQILGIDRTTLYNKLKKFQSS